MRRPDPSTGKVQREDKLRQITCKSAALALVLALIIVSLAKTANPASAADTGFAVPSSYANIPGMGDFNQPQEGCASDDSYAVDASDDGSVSYYGFGFSIPSGNTIDGIEITVEGYASSGSGKSFNVSLSYDNGTSWTASKNTGVMTTTDNTYTLGGAADNWDFASWTPAIINSDYFRVRIDVSGTGGNTKIDSTQAKVYYSVPGTTTTVAASGTPSTYGDSVTIAATVTRSGGSGTPAGTVEFLNSGVSIGTGTLSDIGGGAATATLSISTLAAGSHVMTAVYGENSDFHGSTSTSVTQVVNKRNITVTADAQSKVYGDADPALTYKITSDSLVSGDSFTGTLTRAAGDVAGTYAIQQGTLALSSNYNLTYEGASLTIAPLPIIMTPPAPTLDGIGPDSGHPGETLEIVIDGIDFSGATAIRFGSGATVTVNRFVVDSPTRITANVTIDPGASPGRYDVTVTTPSGDGALTKAFLITKESPAASDSRWFWLLTPLLALSVGGLLLFVLFRRRRKKTLWDVVARHAYS